jgi:hypothetical protein
MNQAMLRTDQPPAQIVQALERGERLLWHGAPRRGLRLRAADLFLIPFSLLWGGLAIFKESSVPSIPDAPWFMKLGGIFFVLIGLYLIVGRFFADAKMREKTLYALTGERVLILSGVFRRESRSLTLRNLSEVSVVQARDDSGTITFGSAPPFAAFFGGIAGSLPGGGRNGSDRMQPPPQFEMIDDVAAVAALVREARRHAT